MATEVMTAPEGRIIHKTYAVLSGAAIPQRVHVTQYDESLPVIACTLYKDGQLYTIPEGASVRLRMNKNGLPVYHEAIGIDDARHVVYLEITAQMTVLYGEFAMVLEVETSDGKTAGTSYLRLIVRQNPIQNPELDNIPDYTANSNRLTAEGVKKLQDESSTQQKAIEDKGKNTLESIPADYSTLSGKVNKNTNGISGLKEDLDKLNEGGLIIKDEVIAKDVNNWLDEHPEATTTVQDGAITETKIAAKFLPYISNSYITPQMFGAKGDGISDDTDNIKATITYARDKKSVIVFPAGNYGISEPLDVNFDIKIIGENAFIIPLKDMTHFMGINTTEKTNSGYIFGLGFSAGDTFSVTTGIKISYVANFRLHGLKIFNTTVGIDYIKGYELLVDSCLIRTSIPSEDSIGMDIKTSDSHFSNIIIINYHVGIYDEYGGNFYDKIHAWIANTAIVKNSIYFRANGSAYISQCFNDTYETAFYINGKNNVIVSELRNIYNSTYINSDVIDDVPVLFYISDGEETGNLKCFGVSVPDVGSLFNEKKIKFSNVEKEKWDSDFKSLSPDSLSLYCDGVPDGLIVYNPGITVATNSDASSWDIKYNRIYRRGHYCKLEFAALYRGTATNLSNVFNFANYKTRPAKSKELFASLSKTQYDIPDAFGYLYIGGGSLSLKLPDSESKFVHFDVGYYAN